MASGPHTFVIVGVFSAEQFHGNPVAIVAVRGNALPQQKKELIAKEFGYTATVFIHDAPNPGLPRRVEMFTRDGEELTFSGHCVLGTAHYIFQCCELSRTTDQDRPLTTVLMTKAGPVPILYNARRQVAACSVPHTFHLHSQHVGFDKILNVQPQIQIVPTIAKLENKTFPVVSITKGMTFSLIDLTETSEVLPSLEAGKAPEVDLDEGWKPSYVGALYYKKNGALVQEGEPTIHSIQARVITKGIEDAGTGSACSALACYLSLNEDIASDARKDSPHDVQANKADQKATQSTLDSKAHEFKRHVYAIQQGVEMGRGCTIAIEVDVSLETDGSKKVKNVTLSGRGSFFVRGELMKS